MPASIRPHCTIIKSWSIDTTNVTNTDSGPLFPTEGHLYYYRRIRNFYTMDLWVFFVATIVALQYSCSCTHPTRIRLQKTTLKPDNRADRKNLTGWAFLPSRNPGALVGSEGVTLVSMGPYRISRNDFLVFAESPKYSTVVLAPSATFTMKPPIELQGILLRI